MCREGSRLQQLYDVMVVELLSADQGHTGQKAKEAATASGIKRFNGRLSQVLRPHYLNNAEDLKKTLHRFV